MAYNRLKEKLYHFCGCLPPSKKEKMFHSFALVELIFIFLQELGYLGEIGYQTFLYSSEADVRRVFMFLVEKLPKESDKGPSHPEGKILASQ